MQECRGYWILPGRRKCIINCKCRIGSFQARIEMCASSTRETADHCGSIHLFNLHRTMSFAAEFMPPARRKSRGRADSGFQGWPGSLPYLARYLAWPSQADLHMPRSKVCRTEFRYGRLSLVVRVNDGMKHMSMQEWHKR
jgi:hypothetical protein